MARTSQWDDNDEMWDFVVAKRKGGTTYREIHGLLSVKERERFGLVNVPSEAVIRYNLKMRRLLGSSKSDLPTEELAEHHQALVFMGSLLRYQVAHPPRMGPSKSSIGEFRGFANADVHQPVAKTEIEEEIQEEWEGFECLAREPELFSRYDLFREHMNCTLVGRKVNNALDAVKRTAADYNAERIAFFDLIEEKVEKALADTNDAGEHGWAMTLYRSLEPTEQGLKKKPVGDRKTNSGRFGVEKQIQVIREALESTVAKSEVVKKLRKLNTAQNNLKAALTPVELVRKMVRDSECVLCSAESLERAQQ
jgi:hypothetical protein